MFLYILILILRAATSIYAQGNLGQSGMNFLQIPVEPQGAAIGGAAVSICDGASAIYWNPAGMIIPEKLEVNLSQTNWFFDTKLSYVGVSAQIGPNNAIGISFTSFYMEDMEITTVYEPDGTDEYYSSGSIAGGLSYARRMTDRFSFGITTKYAYEYIWNESAGQIAFDIGSIYRTDFLNLRLGMAIRNIGAKIDSLDGDDIAERIAEELARNQSDNPRVERLTPGFRLPQVFQMGIAIDPLANLTTVIDVIVPSDNVERIVIGGEYSFSGLAYIRAAYIFNSDVTNFSVGGGINIGISGTRSSISYAFTGNQYLNNIHQFGINFKM